MDYLSTKWQKLRQKALRRDGYKCQICNRYGKQKQATTVHHVNPVEHYPDLQYVLNNLISLCDGCHNKCHDRATHELTAMGKQLQERINKKYNIS